MCDVCGCGDPERVVLDVHAPLELLEAGPPLGLQPDDLAVQQPGVPVELGRPGRRADGQRISSEVFPHPIGNRFARGVDEHAIEQPNELVAGGAVDGPPIRKRLTGREDLLHHDPLVRGVGA